jgi:hypothetical protein
MIAKNKYEIRESEECDYCRVKKCKYKSTLAFFEKNKNLEIDCWLRIYDKKYITGYHFPFNVEVKYPSGNKYNVTKWTHLLNEKFSVLEEKYIFN